MASILPAGSFNPASLQASGFYIIVTNPPSYLRGVPTDVVGFVGTAPWGPVNTPVHVGSGQDAVQAFGPITAASVTDPYDLPSDATLAFLQSASQASLEGWMVRVTDGTDTAATSVLAGAATAAAATITVSGTITANDTVTPTATSSALTGSPIALGPYTVLVADTVNTIATAICALINANAVLAAASVYATVSGAAVTIYAPSALSPAIVWTAAKTGTTEIYTVGSASASTAGATVSAIFTGSGGNSASGNMQMTITAGVQTGTFNVSLVPPFGGNSELFQNINGTNFWANLKNALNLGISPARGPSHIATITGAVNPAVGAPTTGNKTFSGGTDGRSGVTTATLLGSDTAQPRTGLYSLRNLNPGVGIVWLTGCVDPTAWPAMEAFGQSESCSTFEPFPSGYTTAQALTAVATNGISDPSFNYLNDWVYWFDTVNNVVRLSPPTAVVGAMWATYAPQNSWDNKPVNGILGTVRNSPTTGNNPYTLSEIGQLQSAGIGIITNPCNAGTFWGTWGGRSTSQNPATQPSEYWRMTCYLARSLAGFGGQFVGMLQSQQASDPLRMQVKNQLNSFFNGLGNQIDGFNVICTFTTAANAKPGYGINTPGSVAQHYLYVMCVVRYLSSVWYFILALQGGTTVNVQIVESQPVAQAA